MMLKQALWSLLSSLVIGAATGSNEMIFIVKEHYRNPEAVYYRSTRPQTILSCGHECLRNSRCTATNFRQVDKSGDGDCELLDLPASEMRHGLEFDEGWVFSQSTKDDCRFVSCENGGSCVYNEMSDDFHCSCPTFWTGDKCQEIKDTKVLFEFTTLGARGRHGPSSNLRYKDTVLENILVVNGIQTWIAPMSGKYNVTACGASGANGTHGSQGGKGALVNGTIFLERGDILKIIVGQEGETKDGSRTGGGGGGSFVVSYKQNNYKALVVAGGGGGGGFKSDGGDGRAPCSPFTSIGGEVCASGGATKSGGGGGFRTSGTCYKSSYCINELCSSGGESFLEGGVGGKGVEYCDGGFGGGGACSNIAGGGGGYTGGKVTLKDFSNGTKYNFANGGCSFVPPDGITTTGFNSGGGYVTLNLVS